MEFRRTKNADTRVVFPIQKNDGTFITGATGLDSEYALLGAHGSSAPTWTDCAHEATEIGSTGLYYLDLHAAELNDDYAVVQVKSSSTGAIVQVLEFNLTDKAYDEAVLVHAHVGTIDGHITADYGTTEKAAIDLLDDAIAGLVDIHTDVGTANTNLLLALKLLRNKTVTDPATGILTVYDDNGSTPLFTAHIYEDVAGTVNFQGRGGNRRERLVAP